MTVEEIKQNITMSEVLAKYGIKVKHGMACCPIHGEKHPSMQVFKDGYKCYACGSHGDVITFVMEMEHCDFKTAFISLGGTYEKHKSQMSRTNTLTKFARNKTRVKAKSNAEADFRKMIDDAIKRCDKAIEGDPFSDRWCFGINTVQWLWHVYETKYIEGEEVNEGDVIRVCREVRQRCVVE